jgi:hypothetical protein
MIRRNLSTPRFEILEDRLTPAGNVAAVGGEVLQLRGDDAANQVRITQSSGSILVEGLDGTTINGRASVRFGSGLEKVDIKLFGGADGLTVRGLRASTDINIEMDSGNDTVALSNVLAGVNLSVKTDDGFDRVTASGVRTGGDFYVETGEGRSAVAIAGSQVGKTLTVIGKNGLDDVIISGVITGEDLNVESGEGNDIVRLIDVRSEKNIKVDADTGDDFVGVRNVFAAKDAVFLGEDGFDTFENRGVSAGEKLEIKEFDRFV